MIKVISLRRLAVPVFAFVLIAAILAIILRPDTAQSVRPVFASSYQTLILDAGHGGPDGGAVGVSGTVEKHINLQVALRCEALLALAGVDTLMIRREDMSLHGDESLSIGKKKVADMRRRLEIVKNASSPVFVSIHMNSFTQKQYSGAQIFYSKNNPESLVLAETMREAFRQGVAQNNKREVKPAGDDIYLLKNITNPAVIVECGFLSNPTEEALLQTDHHQKKLAMAISAASLRFLHDNAAPQETAGIQ